MTASGSSAVRVKQFRHSRFIRQTSARHTLLASDHTAQEVNVRSLMTGIVLIVVTTIAAIAQTNATDGAIDGFVQDETGAYVPGASVAVKNLFTGVESTTKTDNAGYYRLPLLKIGEYEVVINSSGF